MYAMDTAVHYEHRNDSRRSRWSVRRPASTRPTGSERTDDLTSDRPTATDSPVHEFVD